jgi:hypothetical protein
MNVLRILSVPSSRLTPTPTRRRDPYPYPSHTLPYFLFTWGLLPTAFPGREPFLTSQGESREGQTRNNLWRELSPGREMVRV